MSPLRPKSSVLAASSCLHQLSVLNATHNGNTRKTDSCDICLETCTTSFTFHGGCRVPVNCATDGDHCKATSADIILLSALFYQSRFPLRLGRTEVSRGGGVCKDSLSVRKCIRTGEIIWPALTDFHFAFLWHGLLSNWQCSRFVSSLQAKKSHCQTTVIQNGNWHKDKPAIYYVRKNRD